MRAAADPIDKPGNMERVFRNFYRNFYHRTGGFLPTQSHDLRISPGDFFQIMDGDIMVLGNILRKGLINDDEVILVMGSMYRQPDGYFIVSPKSWREQKSCRSIGS